MIFCALPNSSAASSQTLSMLMPREPPILMTTISISNCTLQISNGITRKFASFAAYRVRRCDKNCCQCFAFCDECKELSACVQRGVSNHLEPVYGFVSFFQRDSNL